MKQRALVAALATVLPAMLFQAPALAGEWNREAGIAIGTYFSDNICLSDLDKQDEWVGTARPDVSLSGRGGRFSMNLNAGVELNTLGQSDIDCATGQGRNLANRESVIPRVNLNSNFDVVRDWLTLEATGSAGQNPINPFAAGGDNAINARENTNVTYRYGVGARSERSIGDRGFYTARYNFNEQFNAVRLLGDSTENSFQAGVGTDPAAARLSFGLSGNYREIEYDESDLRPGFTNEFASVEANAALRLNRFFVFDVRGGEEFNDFISADDDIDGTFWDAGVTWSPSARVSVALGYGERFFGSTPRLDINYRHKRSRFNANYQRTVSLPRNLRGQFAGLADDDLSDIDELPGDPIGGIGNDTFVGQGPVENETFSVSWSFQARRTGISLGARESQQTRFETGNSATFRSTTLTLTRQLGSQTSTDVRLRWRENEGDDDSIGLFGQEREAWTASWGVSRDLGSDTRLTLRYQYTDQDANNSINTFIENRIDLNLRYRF